MILNKLFKAKWQHKDANVRIEALNDFDLNDAKNKNTLTQLINSDPSELVRRAALLKINSYAVWLKASIDNSMKPIQQFAETKVHEFILSSDADLVSLTEKQQYLDACDKKSFLEQWLFVEHDAELLETLLARVNKPNLLSQFMIKTDNLDLQQQLLSRIDSFEQLEKLQKRLAEQPIGPAITKKYEHLLDQKERPIKLRKQLQLMLSKLLALKEQTDYEQIKVKKAELEEEWTEISAQFEFFDQQEQQTHTEKYNHIEAQLKKHFAIMEEAYQQQRIAKEQAALKLQQETEIGDVIADISKQVTQAVFDNQQIDDAAIEKTLSDLSVTIAESVIEPEKKKTLQSKVEGLTEKLTQLPLVAECVANATTLISKLSELAIPTNKDELNQRKPIYDDWLKQWSHINQLADHVLPESIAKARDELKQKWSVAIQPLVKEQNQTFDLIKRKMSELKRLIASGKYKSAFGLHKKLTFLIQQVSEAQQQKLAKDFDNTSERINELHELESFIVTPKKQQLLEEIKQLVAMPLDNPVEQAEKVKSFRKHWSALGHADEAIDKDLNAEFNKCCEEAFAPCRLFYAEQSKVRDMHLAEKHKIVEKLDRLLADSQQGEVNWQGIENRLNKLMSAWRQAGDVDRKQYQLIYAKYRKVVDPIKQGIHKFYDENVALKQGLIEQAQQELETDDVFNAINKLKDLQRKWREIGYAGPHKENNLWQTFRKINDQVFARREEIKAEQKQERLVEHQENITTLETLITEAENVSDLASGKTVLAKLNNFINSVKQLKPFPKDLINQANTQVDMVNSKIEDVRSNKEKQVYINLFDLFEQRSALSMTETELADNNAFNELPNALQKLLKPLTSVNEDFELRQKLTLELEILANVESPAELAEQRMQVQVQLMADKMMQADTSTVKTKLESWLSCGLLTSDEAEQLNRVKAIFIK